MADETWTPLKMLKWTAEYFDGHRVSEPRLDAELLLSHALGVERIGLYTDFERILSPDELSRFRALVRERAAGRPVKYILGRTEFYSLPLAVDERVLIPRPETELLVERALAILASRACDEFALVLDLCTGSGAVAVALAANFPDANYLATDISSDAIGLARENAASNDVADRIEFLTGDLFEPLLTMALDGKLDLVVSNPPYVAEDEWSALPVHIREFEPRRALVAGPAGTEIHARILAEAASLLRPAGALLMEMDPAHKDAIAALAAENRAWAEPVFHNDYSKRVRVVELKRLPG